jgi:hypothetical protein
MYRDVDPPVGISFGKSAILLAAVFAIALGVVIGTRLSSDAIAVLVGVIAGVAAGIPTALLLIFVTRRRREEVEPEPYEGRRQMAPPVIVVTPGSVPQGWPPYGYAGMPPAQQLPPPAQQLPTMSGPRRFRVMGLDEEDMEPLQGRQETPPWYQ